MIRRPLRLSLSLSLRHLKRLHGRMVVQGFNSQRKQLGDLLLYIISSDEGRDVNMDYANKVFAHIAVPDLFMWNTMLRGFGRSSHPMRAFSLYSRMIHANVSPDVYTFLFLLNASSKSSAAAAGAQFHAVCTKLGFDSDTFVRNSLINFHASCGDLTVATVLFDGPARRDVVARTAVIRGHATRGDLTVARQLFDESPCRDVVYWNIMIAAYSARGDMVKAREMFDAATDRDVVSWNTMIAGYVQRGLHGHAMEIYEEMRAEGWRPDEATIVSLLSSCSHSGSLDQGQRIHYSILEFSSSRIGLSLLLNNALIGMYAKCGRIDKALEMFERMTERDVWTWNSVIGGLAFHGRIVKSITLFEQMRATEVLPNDITFVAVLSACSHGGMVDEGRRYFSLMRNEYRIEPNVKHFGCVADMLGRAGFLAEAFEIVESMKVEGSGIVWRSLLGACRVHGDVELAEYARKKIIEMREDSSGDYVLLSNVYASTGKWRCVEAVRRSMDQKGLRKAAGHTLV